MENNNIVKQIDEIKNELELRIGQYAEKSSGENYVVEPREYINLDDSFFSYYPKPKPFQRFIGKIKF